MKEACICKAKPNSNFNSIYSAQESVCEILMGNYYHVLGPFILLKYLTQEENSLLYDKEIYEKANELAIGFNPLL